jgi:ferredoxin
MRVRVDGERCHGHQMCAIAAPLVFGSDDYGNAVVLVEGELSSELEADALRAAGNCPEHAVIIEP